MAAMIRVRHRFIVSADPSIHAHQHKIPVAIVGTALSCPPGPSGTAPQCASHPHPSQVN